MNAFVEALNSDIPLIAVPLMASDAAALLRQVDDLCQSAAQVAEWRVDSWPEVSDQVVKLVAARLKEVDKFLLVTIRTREQGGHFTGDAADYVATYRRLLALGLDAIDIEANLPTVSRKALVRLAHQAHCAVVGSYHDFKQTPKFEAAQAALQAQSLWADVVKLAAMPQTPGDTLVLLATSAWAKKHLPQPAVVIGMGPLGQLTRVATGEFAPALTFARLTHASAPGQLSVAVIKALQEETND